jgi:hypothetical protein
VLQDLLEEFQRTDVIGREAGGARNQTAQDGLESVSAEPAATDDVFARTGIVARM